VGQRSIFDTEFYDRKGVEVRALVDTNCLFLSRESITSVIGKLSRLGQPAFPFSRKLVKGLSLKDLQLHKIIGRGMFGRVWLVSHKDTKSVYGEFQPVLFIHLLAGTAFHLVLTASCIFRQQ